MRLLHCVVTLACGAGQQVLAAPADAKGQDGFFAKSDLVFLLDGGIEMAGGELADETNVGGFARFAVQLDPVRLFPYVRGELSLGGSRLGRSVEAAAKAMVRTPLVGSLIFMLPIIRGGGPYLKGGSLYLKGGGGLALATADRGGKTRYSEGSVDPVLQYGGGLELAVVRRMLVRLEASRTHQMETVAGEFWQVSLGFGMRTEPAAEPLPAPVAPPSPPAEPPPPPVVSALPDSDGDGLVDNQDKCPSEVGPAENNGCPWPDNDRDGVRDADDKCPNKPGLAPHGCPDTDEDGLADHVDACQFAPGPEPTGCPASDRDGDGVLDDVDQCPDVPGEKPAGCPKKVLVVKHEDRIEIKQQLNFETGKATIIGATSFDILDQVAAVLRSNPSIKVVIEGHTDDRGGADYNLTLSNDRAGAVRTALIERGIDAGRMESIGYGSTKPIASNRKASGRAANRRSEFRIVQPGASTPAESVPDKPAEPAKPPPAPKGGAADPSLFYLKLVKAQTLREMAKTLWKSDVHAQLLADHNPEAGGPDGKVNAGAVVKFPRRIEYTVRKGDTLADIAKRQLGSGKLYKLIAEASKSVMPDPDKMDVGMTLTIPLVLPEAEKLENK